ncbi:hypothetical protein [Colwellia sp. 12G3]|uniref:hypothetical protein n=1 Tax=Colwellia sp. 12G3 TaxID=2058299 RepID=UPI000C34413D|nr:hypothetical protein [Colwellia sp. 12G3]PKI12768.1 hypothetical protein CXF71_18715 [Colwellia sp. 12G3]
MVNDEIDKVNEITDVKDWQDKERRLQEIKNLLDKEINANKANLEIVINLRIEARVLAAQLKSFLDDNFKKAQ